MEKSFHQILTIARKTIPSIKATKGIHYTIGYEACLDLITSRYEKMAIMPKDKLISSLQKQITDIEQQNHALTQKVAEIEAERPNLACYNINGIVAYSNAPPHIWEKACKDVKKPFNTTDTRNIYNVIQWINQKTPYKASLDMNLVK